MKYIYFVLIAIAVAVLVSYYPQAIAQTVRVFTSAQVGTNPVDGYCLTTNGATSTWAPCDANGGSKWTDTGSFINPTNGESIYVTGSSTLIELVTNTIRASSSAGTLFRANSGTLISDFGAGGGSNVTFYGGVNIDGTTRLATSLTGLLRANSGVVTSQATGTLTETVSGLEFDATRDLIGGSAILSLSTGYTIPLTASTTEWANFYNTPSTRITAGNHIDWTGNTLDVITTGDWTGTFDGQNGSYYLNATNLNAGTVNTARISGSYTGITGVGTITAGTWQGTAIADTYIDNTLTITAGTINGATIGASTPSTGVFTNATTTNLNVTTGTIATLNNTTLNGDTINATTLTLGNDAALSRGAANRLDLASGDTFNIVSGALQMAATDVITSGRLFLAATGTVAAPAFSFSADPNTGIFSTAADTVNITTGGTSRFFINNTGAIFGGTLNVNGGTTLSSATSTNLGLTRLNLGGDSITDFTGTGIVMSGNSLTASLGTDITAAEIANGDHGFFTYTAGVAALDTNGLTSASLAGALSDETGSGAAVFAASPTFTGTVTLPLFTATSGTSTNFNATTLSATNAVFTSATLATTTISSTTVAQLTVTGSTSLPSLTASRLVVTDSVSALSNTITSANVAASVSDETGTGVLTFATAPTFTTRITTPEVTGGTAVNSTLTLRTTTGAGTSDRMSFLVGNNGNREAMRIHNSGTISIGSTTAATTSVLSVVGTSTTPIFTVFTSGASKLIEMLNTGVTTLLGTWDMSGATVKQDTYKSFTWPGVATTTSATTTVALGTAYTAEQWTSMDCFTSSSSGAVIFTDGMNRMNGVTATTTVSRTTLSTNNTFTAMERRYVEIGPLTAATVSCTVEVVVNN